MDGCQSTSESFTISSSRFPFAAMLVEIPEGRSLCYVMPIAQIFSRQLASLSFISLDSSVLLWLLFMLFVPAVVFLQNFVGRGSWLKEVNSTTTTKAINNKWPCNSAASARCFLIYWLFVWKFEQIWNCCSCYIGLEQRRTRSCSHSKQLSQCHEQQCLFCVSFPQFMSNHQKELK